MRIAKNIAVLLTLLALTLAAYPLKAADKVPVSDVRILIDVSGSMKKNDPENLRAPALRMLAGLTPDESHSGVWTFAKFVNMLVPWKSVDDAWRKQAESGSRKIHSYGLFTDIEQVLKKATANAMKADPDTRRSLILLSDGFVDLQAGDEASKASRQRIIDQLIPKLKQANITVHTIALSENADHTLLKALSFATDGWYQRADTNEDLERVFLHLFEKAAKRDTLPLKDNHFTVDKSVEEMTVLAFRREGADSTRLILPDGKILTPEDRSDHIRWLHEANYDLITIDTPVAGNWMIDAELDPDNRVMVVTDMQLKTTDLPNNVLVGEKFDFEAYLTEQGEPIEREDFLNLIEASLLQNKDETQQYLSLERGVNDHVFRSAISDLSAGENDIVFTLKTDTFERQRRQTLNVVAMPFTIEQQQLDAASRSHKITVQANTELIKPASVTITSLLQAEDGSEWPYDMLKTTDNNWQLTLADLEPDMQYSLALQIRAQTQKGRDVFLQPEVMPLDYTAPAIETAENDMTAAEVAPEQQASETVFEIDEDLLLGKKDVAATTKTSESMTLLIGNVVMALLLIAGIVWWRRQSKALTQAGDLL